MRNLSKWFFFFIFCVLTSLFSTMALATASYYVSTKGADSSTSDGSSSHPWRTIQYAIDSISTGVGVTIHVTAGSYSDLHTSSQCAGVTTNICVDKDGSSSARFRIQCDNPASGCKIVGAANYGVIIEASYVDFAGFEVGPCSGCTTGLQVLGGSVFRGKGVSVHILNNYIHDIAQSGNDGNGFGSGCPSSGMIEWDGKGQATTDLQIIGNRLNNGGKMSLGGACNQYHGLYVSNGTTVENNIISNIVGQGINFGSSPCHGKISNNLVFHNGQRGILIASYGGDNCSPDGSNTVNNNIVINDNVNNPGVYGIEEYSGGAGTNNLYSNNLLQGNSHSDVIHLTTSPSSAVQNLFHQAATSIFVNYRDDGLGDYHLKSGSIPVGRGVKNCTSGQSGCTPTTDLDGKTRGSVMDIGPYMSGSSAPAPTPDPNPAPSGPIALIQKGSASSPTSGLSSAQAAFPGAQVAGHLNVVVVGWNDSTSVVTSITDSLGNSYKIAAPLLRGTKLSQVIYYASNIKGGSNKVTVVFNQTAAFPDVRVLEYSGVGTLVGSSSGSGNTATSETSGLSVAAGQLLIASNTVFTLTSGPGAGYILDQSTSLGDIVEHLISGKLSIYKSPTPLQSAGNWVMQSLSFK